MGLPRLYVSPNRSYLYALLGIRHEEWSLESTGVGALLGLFDRVFEAAMVLVAAYGGLRAGELVGLRRRHVDLLERDTFDGGYRLLIATT